MKSLGSLEDVARREKEEEKVAQEVAQKKRRLTQTYLAEAHERGVLNFQYKS